MAARSEIRGAVLFDLSITIVSYNNKRDIEKCLSSLFLYEADSGLSMQVFIVNNSTTEDCGDLAQKFSVTVIDLEKNKGFGGGHNAVLSRMDSRFHVVLNPDVLFKEPILGRLVKYLDDNPEIGALAPLIVDADGNVQDVYRTELTVCNLLCRYAPRFLRKFSWCERQNSKHSMKNVAKNVPFECEFIQGSFLVIPSSLFKRLEGFDERFFMYAEDADLCKRIRLLGRKVECFPEGKVVHKWEKASHRSLKLCRIHVESLIKYFCKYMFTRGGGG